jgi:hypothetical protein
LEIILEIIRSQLFTLPCRFERPVPMRAPNKYPRIIERATWGPVALVTEENAPMPSLTGRIARSGQLTIRSADPANAKFQAAADTSPRQAVSLSSCPHLGHLKMRISEMPPGTGTIAIGCISAVQRQSGNSVESASSRRSNFDMIPPRTNCESSTAAFIRHTVPLSRARPWEISRALVSRNRGASAQAAFL